MKDIGYFHSFWLFLWEIIKQSYVYKLLRGLYDCISAAWQRSFFANLFRREYFKSGSFKESVTGRILNLPFAFLSWLKQKIGAHLSQKIDTSFFVYICRVYLNNLLSLNTRFIGVMFMGFSLGILIGIAVMGASASWILHVMFLAGLILTLTTDRDLTKYIKGSFIAKLLENIIGIDFSYDFYDESYIRSGGRLYIGAFISLLGGLVFSVSPIMGLAVVFGLALFILVMKSTLAGVFMTVFLAPLMPTMVMALLVMLCLFSIFVKSIIDENFSWRFEGVGFLLLGLLVVYLFSALNSFAMTNSLSIFAIYLVFIAFYFVVINTVKTKKQLFDILTVFVLSGAVVCLYGVMQYLFGWDASAAWIDDEMFSDIKMRVYSTLENPNVLGEYILLVLPVCVALIWQKKKGFTKLVYTLAAGLIFLTLILTFSRGCWIGFMVAAGIFVTFVCGKMWGLALIALPFVPMIIPDSIINRFLSVGDMKDSSTSYRVYIWMGSLAMVKDFWASGIGLGTEAFKSVYPFYSYSGIVAPHSHNMFLQILVESGVIGIGVFLTALYMFIKKMISGYQHTEKKYDRLGVMIVAIAAGVIGFALQGMFDNCFYNYRVFLIFWTYLALGISAVYIAKGGDISD